MAGATASWGAAWKQRCIDGDGQAVPWFTYPAIEYLKQLDFGTKDIFEYGSGHPTVWFQTAKYDVSKALLELDV